MFALRPLTVYARVYGDRLRVRIVETGGDYEDVALLAVHRESLRVVAVGEEAGDYEEGGGFEVVRPFGHPRVAIDDPHIAGKLLLNFRLRAQGGRGMLRRPRYVLHLPGDLAGGLTALEKRGFLEMARFAGALSVALWDWPEELEDARIVALSRAAGRELSA